MNRRLFSILICVVLAGLAGCAAQEPSSPSSSAVTVSVVSSSEPEAKPEPEPESEPEPAETTPDIDIELVQEIQKSMRVTYEQGIQAPGAMEEFCKENPDFLWERVGQLHTSSRVEEVMGENGMQAWLLLPPGVPPEDDLFNRERLAQFVENQKNGVADRIVILSSGSPIPLWLTVISCDTSGAYQMTSGYPREEKLEWFPAYAGQEILETETEWILRNDEQAWVSYPRFGYEPIPLGEVTGPRPEAEVQALIPPLWDAWDAQTDSIVAREPETVDGVDCYVFERHRLENGEDHYTGDCLAVAKDLSRYYFVEQVDGNWVLLARPKAAPAG